MIKLRGQDLLELPKDLYIPPDAMLVILEMFEGPLDLLLYLIRKHNLDLVDIPVAKITAQYLEYLELIQYANLELVADYLEMAAILIEIKARMLLPTIPLLDQDQESDPRAELVKRLQEYEQIKQAAANLDLLPRQERDYFPVQLSYEAMEFNHLQPQVKFSELLLALQKLLNNQELKQAHNIIGESLSVRVKMANILQTLHSLQFKVEQTTGKFYAFTDFLIYKEGRIGIVVTFLAILELAKENLLEILQNGDLTPIYIRSIQ